MRPLQIALKDLRIVVRDFKALALIIAMPLILVMILGAALGPMFSHSDRISPFRVALVNNDGGQVASVFLDLLTSGQVKELISVQQADSEEAARTLVSKQEVSCAVIIPKGASNFETGGAGALRVLTDPGEQVRGQIVTGIVQSFTEQYSVISAGVTGVSQAILTAAAATPSAMARIAAAPGGFEAFTRSVVDGLSAETTRAAGLFEASSENAGWITALQYYTASMTVMFVLFGAMLGAKSILEEKASHTLSRLLATEVTRADLILGKTLATFAISFLQVSVLVLFTRFVYGVRWGASTAGLVVASAALSLAATGFAILVAALSKTERVADAVEGVGIQVLAFLGGLQYPVFAFPPLMQTISKATLTRWGLDAYLVLMGGGSVSGIATPAAVLATMGCAFLAVGIWRMRME